MCLSKKARYSAPTELPGFLDHGSINILVPPGPNHNGFTRQSTIPPRRMSPTRGRAFTKDESSSLQAEHWLAQYFHPRFDSQAGLRRGSQPAFFSLRRAFSDTHCDIAIEIS